MSINSTISNVIIEDNIFDYGSYTDETTKTVFGYNRNLAVMADSNITNNTFAGIVSNASNDMVRIGAGTNNIYNNKFIRNSSVINSYINATSTTTDQIIQYNIFDGYNVDGISNENLVIGLTSTSIYSCNKNQTGYSMLSKSQSVYNVNYNSNNPSYYFYGPSNNPAPLMTDYLSLTYPATTGSPTVELDIYCGIDLKPFLPIDVQLLSIQMGLWLQNGTLQNNSSYTLWACSSMQLNSNSSNENNTILDAKTIANNGTFGTSSASTISNMQTAITIGSGTTSSMLTNNTLYLFLDTSRDLTYKNNFNTNIRLSYNSISKIALNNSVSINLVLWESPIVLRYRW